MSVFVALGLALPAEGAGTVTIGSNLGRPGTAGVGSIELITHTQVYLDPAFRAPGGLTSPVNGTVVRWRIRPGASGGAVAFRVIRRLGGGAFTGAGTSPTVMAPPSVITPFETQLPIAIGDGIGIDCCFPGGLDAIRTDPSALLYEWRPRLADGAAGRPPTDDDETYELAVNADIEPTSAFTLDAAKPRKNGKVKVTATLPNPGTLIAGDARAVGAPPTTAVAAAKRKRRLKSTTAEIAAPGPVTLTVRPTRSAIRKLRDRNKLKAKLGLAFTPVGGTAATETDRLKLRD
jgi:hypothetical protein